MNYNLSVERSIGRNIAATLGYVGSVTRHLQVPLNTNPAGAVVNPSVSVQPLRPFPDFGNGNFTAAVASSNYNSLQAKLERRLSNGLNFLAAYTWSHSLDDAPTALQTDTGFSNTFLIPISDSYSNSIFDIRQRLTFNGYYDLPVGRGRKWLSNGGAADLFLGGWASSLTFVAQTGSPFTVTPSNITSAGGMTALAQLVRDPFQAGGKPDSSNPSITCASKTRTKDHWYNPCAFANPLNGTTIPASGPGAEVTNPAQILQYQGGRRNEIHGPGLTRVNMSLFKNLASLHEQMFQLRADVFNLLNTPAYGNPSTANDSTNGGLITAPQSLQNLTPDARFFQLSAKYIF